MFNLTQSQIMQNWDVDNTDTPLVSVRCITYNHEPFISQALDGFIMQKTNYFPFEVIIHNGTSTGKTTDTIRESKERTLNNPYAKFKRYLQDYLAMV